MGILKTGMKLVGSVALGATGIASTLLRSVACASDNDALADTIGNIEDKCFESIRDMWTPDEKKTEEYYEAKEERSQKRAENAARSGEARRKEYEELKAKRNQDK